MTPPTDRPTGAERTSTSGPTREFEATHEALLDEYGIEANSRFVVLDGPGVRTHVVESAATGGDVPLVFVHGTASFVGFFAPLLAELDDVHWVAFDRPGFGRSGPFEYSTATLRATVVDTLAGVLDECGFDQVDLVGHSMGGYASLAFARDHPERVRRVVLFGGVPAFPGTRPPLPLRLLTVPVLNRLLERFRSSGEEGVLEFADVFGEREGIRNHPALIRTIAAHEATPKAAVAGRSEFEALFSVRGWYPAVRIRAADLRAVEAPTTVVWGTGDTLGGPRAVRRGVGQLPDARLLAVDAGHVPYFSHPEWCASLL